MSYFEHDGLYFNFEEYGSGVPLIFSHGLGGNLSLVRDLIGRLEGARVIVYDNRGHGRTSGPMDLSKLTFACMADDMAALLDRLEIESAVIGGESMGAGISLAFWIRHRKRVRALILSRPAWLNVPFPPNLAMLGDMAKLIDESGREEAVSRFEQFANFREVSMTYPETASSLLRILQDPTNANLALVYKTIPASVPFEEFDELGTIDVPALILANREDPIHPFDYAQRLAAGIPGARLEEFPSKNRSVSEHRRVFRQKVSDYIQAIDSR